MRQFIHLTFAHILLFARRPPFAIYAIFVVALALVVAFLNSFAGGGGALMVEVSNNILFFQLPLLALLIAPLYSQHRGTRRDWLWASPLELPVLILSQAVAVITGLAAVFVVGGLLFLSVLVLRGTIPSSLVAPLYGYFLLLVLPVTFMVAGVIISLSLLARNTIVVTVTAAGVAALVWLGLFMPRATLMTPLNYTLLTLDINPVAGIGAERPLLLALLLFYLTVAPVVVVAATGVYTRLDHRAGWLPARRYVLAGLSVLALLFFGGGWSSYSVSVRQQSVPEPTGGQVGVWEVVRVEQVTELREQVLQATVSVLLHNKTSKPLDSIELNLNPGLRMTDASVGGKPVAIRQAGETVHLEQLPAVVGGGDEAELELRYEGAPIVLREDIKAATDIGSDDPPSFKKAYISYVDNRTLQWLRDSDWFAWPYSPGPHVASASHRLQISLSISEGPFLSSGSAGGQADTVVYRWENPPQFLVAKGRHREISYPNGEIWIGELSGERTEKTAIQLLQLYNALTEWFGTPLADSAPQHVVELPYLRHAVAGGAVLGFANRIDRQVGWDPVTGLDLAVPMTSAWLSDLARWPEGKLSKTGLARSYEMVCGHPDGADQRDGDCEIRILGGVNPQARSGRWVEEVEWQSNTPPLRQAFAVVIAQGLFMDVSGDQAYIDRQRDRWDTLAAESRGGQFVWPEEIPVGALDVRSNCSLAHFVTTLGDFKSVAGREGMVDFLVALSQRHPPGGRAVTEESVMQILQYEFAFVWVPSESAC